MRINIKLFKQPRSFWVLAFGELWSTFSYYGTQTILALYFIHIFKLTRTDAYLLYGAYAALAYSLPTVAGMLTDKYLGYKNATIIGNGLSIIGNLMLISSSHYLFCLGLATSLAGLGLYRSSSAHLVGTLYQDKSNKKEQGFTLFYLAANIGGVLGPLIYGLVVYAIGWNFGFLCSTLGLLCSIIWFIMHKHLWETNQKSNFNNLPAKLVLYTVTICSCLILSLPFYFPQAINTLIFVSFVVSIIYLISAVVKYKNQERQRLFALLIICFFAMFYFAAGLQIGTTITLFIQYKIQQGFISTKLPASTFSTLYPLFVLLLAPLFTYVWSRLKTKGIVVNTPAKLAISITFAALGISAFAFASLTNFVLTGTIIGNLLLSAGELTLAPAIYTAISDLSPAGIKSTMMGGWLLFIAFGGYLSSLLASTSNYAANILPFHQVKYFGEFLFIAGFTFLIALIVIAVIPKLSKMMA